MADKILVVDDEPDMVTLTKMMLEAQGYQVITASDGDEALFKTSSENPDLILLDVIMPVKGGFDVCKVLKTQKKTKLIPVVMFTILGRNKDIKMSSEYGADGHLSKPFTYESLIATVETYIKAARPHKFSGLLGLTHAQLKGRKMLFEFDPRSLYERYVRGFALEAQAYGEQVDIFTPIASVIHQTLEGNTGIELIQITDSLNSQKLSEDDSKPYAVVYDNLTDLILSAGFQAAYDFTKNMLKKLPNQATALFLFNQDIDLPFEREKSSFHNLFKDKISTGKEGLEISRVKG